MAEGTENICQFKNGCMYKFGKHCQKKLHNKICELLEECREMSCKKDTQKSADITLKGEGADLERIVLTFI